MPVKIVAFCVLLVGTHCWQPAGVSHWARRAALREATAPAAAPESSSSSSPYPPDKGLFAGRDPAELQAGLQDLLRYTSEVISETGPRAGAQRTAQAVQALLRTALTLSRERPLNEQLEDLRKLANGEPDLAQLAKALRLLFEQLGATYIKVGQFIASSPTLFPPAFVLEFQQCLDNTPPTPWPAIKATIERDLGGPLGQFYASIDEVPLASASIAQVHAATLKDGREVVVKVQKPGVSETLRADLGFAAIAARALELLAPSFSRLSLAPIVGDIRTAMLDELDFTKEREHLENFRAFLTTQGLDGVALAPEPDAATSGTTVLTMERLRGVPLTDLEGIKGYTADPEATLINALNTWTLSVLANDRFHADVHAGNLLVMPDGRVGFIDFGIVGRIKPEVWTAVTDLGAGLTTVPPDYGRIAGGLIAMGATGAADAEPTDAGKLAADIKSLFDRVGALEPRVAVSASPDGSVASATLGVDEGELTRTLVELVEVTEKNGLRLPREFGLLVKQALYFDRYTTLLAPTLDPLRDGRVSIASSFADDATAPGTFSAGSATGSASSSASSTVIDV